MTWPRQPLVPMHQMQLRRWWHLLLLVWLTTFSDALSRQWEDDDALGGECLAKGGSSQACRTGAVAGGKPNVGSQASHRVDIHPTQKASVLDQELDALRSM